MPNPRVMNARRSGGTHLPVGAAIGMVHVRALPGTPFGGDSLDQIVQRAVADANALASAGFDGVMIENMHDRPYVQPPHGPETVAALTRVALAVKAALPRMPMGIQVLSCGEREALAIALTADLQWIRCENFVYSHVADEGLLERAAAGPLLRYRGCIGAERIQIWADIRKKHASHAITADLPLADVAHTAEYFGADAVIVTGAFTARPVASDDLETARAGCALPVIVGSGMTPDQAADLLGGKRPKADAIIVGSWIKHEGDWRNAVDPARARTLAQAIAKARGARSRAEPRPAVRRSR